MSNLLLPLLLASVSLQDAGAPSEAAAPMTPMGFGAAVHVVDGAPFAVGAGYKATFDARGFELHPALGEAAPRSLPFRFELESITRGGAFVPFATAEPHVTEGAVEYDRGSVVERYDALPDGLEQSFVFAERPAGAGDLVVRGRVLTELYAAPAAAAPIRFDGVHGGVRVGAVRAIDADGRAFDGGVRWTGALLELVLPGPAVEAARFPLVLDPPIGPILTFGAQLDSNADVTYSDALDKYLVVFQRAYSALDRDVYARRYVGDTGATIDPGPIPIDAAHPGSAQNPACTTPSGSDRFFVAWERGTGPFGPWDVFGASLDAIPSGLTSTPVMLSAGTGLSRFPDLCGENFGLDGTGEALCVWEEQTDPGSVSASTAVGARAIRVSFPSGAVSLPGLVLTLLDGIYDLKRPVVPQHASAGGTVAVLMERSLDGVLGGLILRPTTLSGSFITAGSFLTVNGPPEPDLACDGTEWLIVYQRGDSSDHDLYRWHATFDGQFFQVQGAALAVDPALDETNPSVVHAGTKWFVAFSRGIAGLDRDPFALGLCAATLKLCEPPFALATTPGDHEDDLALAGALDPPDLPSRHALAVWTSAELTPPFAPSVHGQRLDALGAGGPITDLGGGCGAGGTLTVAGPVAVGNPGLGFKLSGADVFAATALLNIDPTPGPPIVCGPCAAAYPSLLFPASYAAGSATLTLPIPCQGLLVGAPVEAQWLVFPTVGTPCSLYPGFSISNRLQLVIGT